MLSGIGYGIAKTATGATTSSATAKPIPSGKPPEVHSLLVIGYDGNKFVFNDPDPNSSNIFEPGFGLLTFDSANGRLSTLRAAPTWSSPRPGSTRTATGATRSSA